MTARIYWLAPLALCLAACATLSGAKPPKYEKTVAVPYVQNSDPAQVGDLYVPAGPGPWPIVLVVHGGGWTGGERSDMDKFAKRLVEAGYAVFNIDYRLAPEHRFPAQLEDLRLASSWLAHNSTRLHLDMQRMAALGYSAGAHLVLMLAYTEPSPLAAVVAGAGPSDLSVYPDSPYCKKLLGGTPATLPEAYAAASPINFVSSDDPPTFLYHGQLDLLVEVEQSEHLYAALQKAGVKAELVTPALLGHMTTFVFDGGTFESALAFLGRTLTAGQSAQSRSQINQAGQG